MRILFSILSAVLIAISAAANAQNYPAYQNIFVNDYAGLLSEGAEATLKSELEALREETGVELTVLTLQRRDLFTGSDVSIEEFATGLFNHWGIGDADRNDGILVLVLQKDREMRIELGKGYGRSWDGAAQRVIDRSFLPAFKAVDYEKGILDGTRDVIATIAQPFIQGETPPKGGDSGPWLGIGIFGTMAALMFGGASLPYLRAARRTCPSCGQRGMRLTRRTVQAATRTATGIGEQTYACKHCDHSDTSSYTIARRSRSRSSSSSFGGGSSGGGGASGRW